MKLALRIAACALLVGCSQNANVSSPQPSSSRSKAPAVEPKIQQAETATVAQTDPNVEAAPPEPLRGVVWLGRPATAIGSRPPSSEAILRFVFQSEIAAQIGLSPQQQEQVQIAQEHRGAYTARFKEAIEPFNDSDSQILTEAANDLAKTDPELLRIGALRDEADRKLEQALTPAQTELLKRVVEEAPIERAIRAREVSLQQLLDALPAARAILTLGQNAAAPSAPLAISPDAKLFAAPGSGKVTLWDLTTGREQATVAGGGEFPTFAPNGRSVASVHRTPLAFSIWDVATGRRRADFPANAPTSVRSPRINRIEWVISFGFQPIAVSPDDRMMAAVIRSYHPLPPTPTVQLWNISDGQQGHTLRGKSLLECVVFSPDGKLVAAGGGGPNPIQPYGEIRLWDVATGEQTAAFEPGNTIKSLAFSPDGTLLASAGKTDEPVQLWDLRTGQQRASSSKHPGRSDEPTRCAFSHDGKMLAVVRGNAVLIWPFEGNQDPVVLRVGERGSYFSALAFSTDGETLATASPVGVILWDVETALQSASD